MGYYIIVYRQKGGGADPARFDTEEGTRLADRSGYWLDDLVRDGKAMDLGGDVCLHRYTAKAEHIIPEVVGGALVEDLARACDPNEWLLVEAWDKS